MNSMIIHIRREFWEHRSLVVAPLVWVGILTLMFTWVIFIAIPHMIDHSIDVIPIRRERRQLMRVACRARRRSQQWREHLLLIAR